MVNWHENYPLMTDGQLVAEYIYAQERVQFYQDKRGRIEHEIRQRLAERDARELFHPEWECKLTPATAEYDVAKLRMLLGESGIPPAVWKEAYMEERAVTKIEPARFDLRKLNAVAKAQGKAVTEAMDAARLPEKPGRISVTRRE